MWTNARSFTRILRTAWQLGLRSVLRVAWYRFLLRLGYYRHRLPPQKLSVGDWFELQSDSAIQSERFHSLLSQADELARHSGWWFFGSDVYRPVPPDGDGYYFDPLCSHTLPDWARTTHWSLINEFNLPADIKIYWELSRFHWMPMLALAHAQSGNPQYLTSLRERMTAWCQAAPANSGVQWRCAQEVSIRLLNTLLALHLLRDPSPKPELISFIKLHLERIAPSMSYARGQDNNHATSEAAALFLGGLYLKRHGAQGEEYSKIGREALEILVERLILPDGSFSQRSVNYHRLLLETLSIVEILRRHYEGTPLSPEYYARASAATSWLHTFVDEKSGDAPNFGAHDGAHLLQFVGLPHREYRAAVELASALFLGTSPYGGGPWRRIIEALDLSPGNAPSTPRSSRWFREGGYVFLGSVGNWGFLHVPTFRFRPSQLDILHFDLWIDGVNVLTDSGSFSYKSDRHHYFTSEAAHNCVEFTNPQLPRLGRFLFGPWRNATVESFTESSVTASYENARGQRHVRRVSIDGPDWRIEDTLTGGDSARLYWHLAHLDWKREKNIVRTQGFSVEMSLPPEATVEVVSTDRSLFYQQSEPRPTIVVDCKKLPMTIITEIRRQ